MTANEIIARHYNVPREVTDEEVIHELVSLRRKRAKGNLDDVQERLIAELERCGMIAPINPNAGVVQVAPKGRWV